MNPDPFGEIPLYRESAVRVSCRLPINGIVIILYFPHSFLRSLPPAAQHPVERDLVDKLDHVEGDQSLLRAVEGTLRIEDA